MMGQQTADQARFFYSFILKTGFRPGTFCGGSMLSWFLRCPISMRSLRLITVTPAAHRLIPN